MKAFLRLFRYVRLRLIKVRLENKLLKERIKLLEAIVEGYETKIKH